MRRLTISAHACTETLRLLISMAWADGRLDDNEKAGVRGACNVFNLSKEFRDKLDVALGEPLPFDQLLLGSLNPKDQAFAYVAAVWMATVDNEVDPKEKILLDMVAREFGFNDQHRADLDAIAKALPATPAGGRRWGDEVVSLFKAIPPRLEQVQPEEVEVSFE